MRRGCLRACPCTCISTLAPLPTSVDRQVVPRKAACIAQCNLLRSKQGGAVHACCDLL